MSSKMLPKKMHPLYTYVITDEERILAEDFETSKNPK